MKPSDVYLIAISLLWLLISAREGNVCSAQEKPHSDIHGRITLTGKSASAQHHATAIERYPGHGGGSATAASRPVQAADIPISQRAVVYLEREVPDRATYTPPEKHPILDQRNLQFHPEVLPVLVGTTVDFPNRDNLFHNVFSYSQPKEFDLGRYPRDDSRSVLFNRPGTVRVYCDIHADMYATILVLPNPYFTTPADDGAYTITGVPEGRYTIVLWVDRGVAERQSIVVRAGETAELNFTY